MKVQNNIRCDLVEFKLITLKTTFSEGFCNLLITFNFEEINILPREIYYPRKAQNTLWISQ